MYGRCRVEIFKEIRGYEGLYAVSNYGRVKSLTRLVKSKKKNQPTMVLKERILKQAINNLYPAVKLYANGKGKVFKVHRLVALEFVANPKGKPEVNHKNLDKCDSRASNLEWCTHKENMEHAGKNGVMFDGKGSKNGFAKLHERDVKKIKKLIGKKTLAEIGAEFGVSKDAIYHIAHEKTWKHVR
jgi:hypothetical protein